MRLDRRLLTLAFGGLFWRTFLLIALLIAVSLAAWFQSFRVIEREPRAERVAMQLVAIVKLTRTALLYSDPDLRRALLQDLESNEGVRVYPRESTDTYTLQPDELLTRLIEKNIRARLGEDTVIAQSVNDIPGVWISFKIDDDDYWVALDRERLDNVTGLQWFGWGTFALALSLFGAAFITSLVNRPFSRLAMAARRVGHGQTPELLPERGLGVAAETNRSFNQMVRDLQQLEADRALMLAGISHDLRTPLARLRLETEMSPSDDVTKAAMIDDIEQMDRIIGRFLDYARPVQRAPELVDLSVVASEALVRMASEDGVRITTRLSQGALVDADATDLRRVIGNLIENARKYGRNAHDGIPHITVQTQLVQARVELSVLDEGPGIPDGQLSLVTRPFYRVDTARSQADGTGLGMAIVQRLVSRYRGTLRLRNRVPGPGLERPCGTGLTQVATPTTACPSTSVTGEQHDRLRFDRLTAAKIAELFIGFGLDVDSIVMQPEVSCDVPAHCRDMLAELGLLRDHRTVDVDDAVAGGRYAPRGFAQQHAAVGAGKMRVSIREVTPDVAECRRAKQRIGDCVQQRIGVRMAKQTPLVGHCHAAEHQRPPWNELMHVVALADSQIHSLFSCWIEFNRAPRHTHARGSARRAMREERLGEREILWIRHLEVAQAALHDLRCVAQPLERGGLVGYRVAQGVGLRERVAQHADAKHLRGLRLPQVLARLGRADARWRTAVAAGRALRRANPLERVGHWQRDDATDWIVAHRRHQRAYQLWRDAGAGRVVH
ncbi:hypothetical protein DFQ28_010996 [Apophysomyces sp. BC1034]|nr:hypothetical protein DFQ28_010996 [Apophysomyces sp. BC1034]